MPAAALIMAGPDQDARLRESAQHRGYRLLKSRKRKPGVGDYGRYGLADAQGKPLFGVGKDGLTATPDEIATFLRKNEIASWKSSEARTQANSRPRAKREPDIEAEPVLPRARPRRRAAPAVRGRHRDSVEVAAPPPAPPPPSPPIRPAPKLAIRPARSGDADAIAALLVAEPQLAAIDGAAVAVYLAALKKAKGGVLVADRGGVIGCVAWSVAPMLDQAAIGRIGLVLVAERDRREGIGRLLMDAAMAAIADADCAAVELFSDIRIRNANGFFRALGFEQASYRFAKSL